MNENEKKKKYNDSVLQVEHGSFTPLVMSAAGGMSRECKHFYRRLSEIIAEKRKQDYSLIRRKISFSLIESIGMCIRGSRSLFCPNLEASISCERVNIENIIEEIVNVVFIYLIFIYLFFIYSWHVYNSNINILI